ncbi:hypothetical protein [Microbacterium paludicola]|uniref:hypothetical protein n=1 Tax=Microbacterium paludicola TaxID=300019 RepID=UPI0011A19803|nr:hypothetical protein [Microbacterium paludicola]
MSETTPDEEELMTRDALDDLLDAAAPPAATVDDRDVLAMVADARKEVRVAPRAKRAAIISGVLAFVMAGGAGVATAAEYFDWASLNNPIDSYTYEVPSGATCDVVFGDLRIVERRDRERRDQIEADLRAWFERTDVVAIAIDNVDEYIDARRTGLEEAGETVDRNPSSYDIDMEYAHAVDGSISDQVMDELHRLGYDDEIEGYGAQGNCPELDQ